MNISVAAAAAHISRRALQKRREGEREEGRKGERERENELCNTLSKLQIMLDIR